MAYNVNLQIYRSFPANNFEFRKRVILNIFLDKDNFEYIDIHEFE